MSILYGRIVNNFVGAMYEGTYETWKITNEKLIFSCLHDEGVNFIFNTANRKLKKYISKFKLFRI